MNIKEAQLDMRQSHMGGGPGVLASGLIWLSAGIAAILSTQQVSVLLFFFGGMLIYPLGIVLAKAFNRSGKHQKDNPLSNLALESTLLLFIGLFIAYLVLQVQADWFFPIMLMIIGGRYVIFASIYGMRIYWILGLVLVFAGIGNLVLNGPFHVGAIMGGAIELVFSGVIIRKEITSG